MSNTRRFPWRTETEPIDVHPPDRDGHMWAWRMENDAGDQHTFYVGVSGSVGEGSPDVSMMALESRGSSEATKAALMPHPPRKVVLGTQGYIEHECDWRPGQRPPEFG